MQTHRPIPWGHSSEYFSRNQEKSDCLKKMLDFPLTGTCMIEIISRLPLGVKNLLSIGAFSKAANITTKTLRYYDKIGLLKPCHVDAHSGYRFYDVSQLESVLLIGRLKSYGFSLDEIALVLKDPTDNRFLHSVILQKKSYFEKAVAAYTGILTQLNSDIENLERGNYFMSYLDQIEVELIQTEPMHLLSIREKINVKTYPDYLNKLQAKLNELNLTPAGAPMAIFHDEEFNPEHYDVEIALPVKEAASGAREFPSCLCAHVTLKGSYSGLPSAYAKIREWVEKEGYTVSAPSFEAYETDPSQTPEEDTVTEVYCPVTKL